jgi:hypothetical protein
MHVAENISFFINDQTEWGGVLCVYFGIMRAYSKIEYKKLLHF